jgi:molecular chaperone GrpE
VVQVKVTDEGIEDTSKENSKEEPVEQDEAAAERSETKETPLENMKKAELLEKARDLRKTADENYDLYMRSLAEIENLKKRFQKDKSDLIKFSNESLIKQLLSVIDNLEKAISACEDENSLHAVKEGVALTLKGLLDSLEKAGLKQVEAEGKPFDPNFHAAVMEQEDNTADPGMVLQELQKGYILNERLIRPAMVIVNKNSS